MTRKPHLVDHVCEQCGSPFQTRREREIQQRFCKRECMTAHEIIHGRPNAHVDLLSLHCQQCGNEFMVTRGENHHYQKVVGKNRPYCSKACSYLGRRNIADTRHATSCKNCGKSFVRSRRRGNGGIYREQALCSRQCKNEWVSKLARARFGIGPTSRRVKTGYVYLRFPAANGRPTYTTLEHRHVMEQSLGRALYPDETVHHVNGQRSDNRLENLQLFSSRHGPGQRVIDKVTFAVEMIQRYPDFAATLGVKLVDIHD